MTPVTPTPEPRTVTPLVVWVDASVHYPDGNRVYGLDGIAAGDPNFGPLHAEREELVRRVNSYDALREALRPFAEAYRAMSGAEQQRHYAEFPSGISTQLLYDAHRALRLAEEGHR